MWLIITALVLLVFHYLCKVELSLLSQSSLLLSCFYYQFLTHFPCNTLGFFSVRQDLKVYNVLKFWHFCIW